MRSEPHAWRFPAACWLLMSAASFCYPVVGGEHAPHASSPGANLASVGAVVKIFNILADSRAQADASIATTSASVATSDENCFECRAPSTVAETTALPLLVVCILGLSVAALRRHMFAGREQTAHPRTQPKQPD